MPIDNLRPIVASHVAPKPQPTAKPTIAGQLRITRSRALATSAGLRPSITSPTSIMKRVMLVVMTGVDGAPFSEAAGDIGKLALQHFGRRTK